EALGPLVGLAPGARLLESDRLRKALHAVSAETRLDPSAYRPEISEKVYTELRRRAETILKRGGTVIVNAVYDRAENRSHIAEAARVVG
ncbi:AAA family ATPase, partial [Acinetobacter baumannii]